MIIEVQILHMTMILLHIFDINSPWEGQKMIRTLGNSVTEDHKQAMLQRQQHQPPDQLVHQLEAIPHRLASRCSHRISQTSSSAPCIADTRMYPAAHGKETEDFNDISFVAAQCIYVIQLLHIILRSMEIASVFM